MRQLVVYEGKQIKTGSAGKQKKDDLLQSHFLFYISTMTSEIVHKHCFEKTRWISLIQKILQVLLILLSVDWSQLIYLDLL